MSVFNWFKREKHPSDNFSTDDREYGIRVREQRRALKEKREELELATFELRQKKEQIKMDLEIQKLQQELEDMQEPDEDLSDFADDTENPEDKILAVLLQKVLANNTSSTPAVNSAIQVAPSKDNSQTAGVSITDDEIKSYLSKIPKLNLTLAKKLNDDQLKAQIINISPNLNQDSINRIMTQIRA